MPSSQATLRLQLRHLFGCALRVQRLNLCPRFAAGFWRIDGVEPQNGGIERVFEVGSRHAATPPA